MKPFSEEQMGHIAARSRALGDPTRVRILAVLAKGPQAVGQIAEAAGTQQSTSSKHLQVLFHAGLVQRQREASAVIYRLTSPDLLEWCRYLATPNLAQARARKVFIRGATTNVSAERRSR